MKSTAAGASCLRILLLLVLTAGLAVPALSQEAPQAVPDTQITTQELQSLINTLEDPLAREAFLERLNTLAAVGEEAAAPEEEEDLGGSLLAAGSQAISEISAQLNGLISYLGTAPALLSNVRSALTEPGIQRALAEILIKVVGLFIAALFAAWLVGRLLARAAAGLRDKTSANPVSQVFLLLGAMMFQLIPLVVFVAVAYLILPLLDPRPITRLVLLTLVNAHVIAQGVIIAARTLLAVDAPGLRPYRMQNETAAYCYVWIRRLAIIIVYGYFINQALLLVGLEPAVHAVLVDLTGLLVALLFIALILQNRAAVAKSIRGGPQLSAVMMQVRGTAALLWHILAMAYVVGVYIVWAFEVEGGFAYLLQSTIMTLAIIALARLAMAFAQRGVERLFHLPAHLHEQYPGLEERASRYRPVINKVMRALIVIIAIMAVLEAWGVDATAFLAADLGRELLARGIRLGLIIAASFLIWELVSALIEKRLKAKANTSRRVLTLLPLLKNVVRLVILVLGLMIALSEIGVDIGPLLASAGVIGLAIGFGAQTLVRDLMTGFFVILEDIIAVGDWVEVGSHTGIVESMSIRTMRLRDLNGNVRIIPFGDVSSVHKVASDYSYALIVIGVAYRENVDEVLALMIQIGDEMREDPQWGSLILEPLDVHGVNELNSSSVDIRVRFKTLPMEQWGVRREYLRRAKLLFDEKGIEIPFPHQTIYFGEDKSGKAPPAPVRIERDAATEEKEKEKD